MNRTSLDADTMQLIAAFPHRFLKEEELEGAKFRRKPSGAPKCWNGAQAYVFCADLSDGSTRAVRFPKVPHETTAIRYEALSQHLTTRRNVPIIPTTWCPSGAELPEGGTHPLITMEWIAGESLEKHLETVGKVSGNGLRYSSLAQRWRSVCELMAASDIAHGDIHAGNILVRSPDTTADCEIILVDYDCVWVPGLNVGTQEEGRAAFQHPVTPSWGRKMDAFPSTLVYLSLIGLAADPSLWQYSSVGDDRLIFEGDDLAEPDTSPVFAALGESADDEVRALADEVVFWLGRDPETHASLSDVLAHVGNNGSSSINVWPSPTRNGPAIPPKQTWGAPPKSAAPRTRTTKVNALNQDVQQSWPGTGKKGLSPPALNKKVSPEALKTIAIAALILLVIIAIAATGGFE